jgi:hypothetical protein
MEPGIPVIVGEHSQPLGSCAPLGIELALQPRHGRKRRWVIALLRRGWDGMNQRSSGMSLSVDGYASEHENDAGKNVGRGLHGEFPPDDSCLGHFNFVEQLKPTKRAPDRAANGAAYGKPSELSFSGSAT